MVAIRKSKTKSRGKKSYNKNSKKIIHNHRLIKKLIAGVFSPKSASTKIQSISRGRSTRQSKKADDLEKLLSKGAQSYKKVLQTLDFKGISMKGQILSRRVIIGAKFKQVDFNKPIDFNRVYFHKTIIEQLKDIAIKRGGKCLSNNTSKFPRTCVFVSYPDSCCLVTNPLVCS